MGLLEILLLGVALATDAFSVTISNTFAFDDHRVSRLMRMPLFFGIITALLCTIALFIGKKLGSLLGDRAEMVGGVVLIMIGLKAFFG
jgi:UPF0059 membrane protein apar_1107